MRNFLYILSILVLCSCSRAVSKTKTLDYKKKDSASSFVDTSKIITTNTQTETNYFGDTLIGSLYIPFCDTIKCDTTPTENFVYTDSIVSTGIKIKVGIMPQNGGFKLLLNTTSKPKETTKTTANTTTEQKGIAQNTQTKTEEKHVNNHKETSKDYNSIVIGLVLVILAFIILFFLFKKKQNGKRHEPNKEGDNQRSI